MLDVLPAGLLQTVATLAIPSSGAGLCHLIKAEVTAADGCIVTPLVRGANEVL